MFGGYTYVQQHRSGTRPPSVTRSTARVFNNIVLCGVFRQNCRKHQTRPCLLFDCRVMKTSSPLALTPPVGRHPHRPTPRQPRVKIMFDGFQFASFFSPQYVNSAHSFRVESRHIAPFLYKNLWKYARRPAANVTDKNNGCDCYFQAR